MTRCVKLCVQPTFELCPRPLLESRKPKSCEFWELRDCMLKENERRLRRERFGFRRRLKLSLLLGTDETIR